MATKAQERQRFIRYFKAQKEKTDVNMHEVAEFAAANGWPLPKPKSPLDLLAPEFSQAAREEVRHDKSTGKPYRANHAYQQPQGDTQLTLWVDIDDPSTTRKKMNKCLILRREQMVGDGVQMTLDADHWNNIHPDEEPIQMELDFTDDVAWRINTPKAKGKGA